MLKKVCLFFIIFLGLTILSGCQSAGKDPTLPLETCHLAGGLQALCGSFSVPENRSLVDGRTLELNVAVIPATSSFPEPDPLFLLAGGPGQAATEVFPAFMPLLEDLNENRDIVLMDQRGTGSSSPLVCDSLSEEGDDPNLSNEEVVAIIHACAEELAETADLTQYSTDNMAVDLDAVRDALGYEKINLYGISYGTRAAQAYARLFPQQVRTMTLDAVTGPELILFLQMPKDGQRALVLLFERCAADKDCKAAFPDFAAEYQKILERLKTEPKNMQLIHPLSGKEYDYTLTDERLANFVYSILYSSDLVSLLPLLVHDAYESEAYAALISQGLLVGEGAGMNLGLLYAVTCSEDAPLIDPDKADALRAGTLFANRADLFLEICQAFPQANIAADFRQPLLSDLPVLLLSGDADPVTPPIYAAQVAEHLANSEHIILPNYGHGIYGVGCVPDIFEQFITDGNVEALDTNCLDSAQPPPFFIDLSGPEA